MYDTVNMVRTISFDKNEVEQRAKQLGINLTDEHWDAINFVKNFYDYHEDEELKIGDYSNALKGRYAKQGGLKYLYSLFPDGPINSVTQLAGISVNSIQDHSMGSVH
ncbi:MAG: TusE/DsrC/DsvC family sulfur relay protein [gamma proteobacterium symbiont of Lucinoma myriamae]|nr:TusE/DsrC/DsvC family sulfur relay protein [gamma proteobacterium symbiont of Lucinoma myriamae]MCU7818675.1 TusE/DsrC/DsvC family sulfur relay protein [gamma proteobacterium symbiont of Lucinoma myriamae]MCU7831161.1 TusE/DsrC/DsvC family sulfur relay protein [gamma proteobacterium symbiont of Lucinoma myriamae]